MTRWLDSFTDFIGLARLWWAIVVLTVAFVLLLGCALFMLGMEAAK